MKFTPDGKWVLVSDPVANVVLVYDAATKEIIKAINMSEGPSGILMAPDGKHAYVACAAAKKLAVIDTTNFSVTEEIETGNVPDGLAYAR